MSSQNGDTGEPVGPVDPRAPLPPELNPRGRRMARREQRQAAASAAVAAPHEVSATPRTRAQRHHGSRGDVLVGAAIGGRVLAALLSVAILLASGWAWYTWNDFKGNIKRVAAIGGGTSKPKTDIDGKDQNILLVGNDDRDSATDAELKELGTTRDGGSYNTDTMMLLHVPANGAKATVISFPRDSYVAIPGHDMNKLNAAYTLGIQDGNGDKAAGARLLVQAIQNLTGLTIDHFVQVDLLGFYRISNAIGGVTVNMCAAVQESNSGINLKKGVNVIKGTQALAFVRQRYGFPDGLGDLDRIKRQQYFLSAVFRQLSSAGIILKINGLLKAITQSLQMDDTLDPLKLATQMQGLTAGNLTFSTIPTDGFATEDAGSVVVVHPADVQARVAALVSSTRSKTASSATSAAAAIKVDVLNGASADGVAAKAANALQKAGFQIGATGNTSPVSTTTIKYPSGLASQARTVAAKVPGATLTQDSSVQVVTLVLGSDGVQVTGTASSSSGSRSSTPTSTPSVTTAADAGCIY